MPSDQSTWLIAVPQDGDSEGLHQELDTKFQQHIRTYDRKNFTQLSLPALKVHSLHDVSASCHLMFDIFLLSLLLHPDRNT